MSSIPKPELKKKFYKVLDKWKKYVILIKHLRETLKTFLEILDYPL